MECLAVFVNDAPSAQPVLANLMTRGSRASCTVVLCPPRLSRRIGKWASNQQRQQWQRQWADRVRRELTDLLPAELAARLDWTTAGNRLSDATTDLRRSRGSALQLLDLRKARLGEVLTALEPGQPCQADRRCAPSVAVRPVPVDALALVD